MATLIDINNKPVVYPFCIACEELTRAQTIAILDHCVINGAIAHEGWEECTHKYSTIFDMGRKLRYVGVNANNETYFSNNNERYLFCNRVKIFNSFDQVMKHLGVTEVKNNIKPFYVKISNTASTEVIASMINRAVECGASALCGVHSWHTSDEFHLILAPHKYSYYGVDNVGNTRISNDLELFTEGEHVARELSTHEIIPHLNGELKADESIGIVPCKVRPFYVPIDSICGATNSDIITILDIAVSEGANAYMTVASFAPTKFAYRLNRGIDKSKYFGVNWKGQTLLSNDDKEFSENPESSINHATERTMKNAIEWIRPEALQDVIEEAPCKIKPFYIVNAMVTDSKCVELVNNMVKCGATPYYGIHPVHSSSDFAKVTKSNRFMYTGVDAKGRTILTDTSASFGDDAVKIQPDELAHHVSLIMAECLGEDKSLVVHDRDSIDKVYNEISKGGTEQPVSLEELLELSGVFAFTIMDGGCQVVLGKDKYVIKSSNDLHKLTESINILTQFKAK